MMKIIGLIRKSVFLLIKIKGNNLQKNKNNWNKKKRLFWNINLNYKNEQKLKKVKKNIDHTQIAKNLNKIFLIENLKNIQMKIDLQKN